MSEEAPTYARPPMPAAWCAARRAEIQACVDAPSVFLSWQQARTYLIELLAQLAAAEAEVARLRARVGEMQGELAEQEAEKLELVKEIKGLRDANFRLGHQIDRDYKGYRIK